MIFQVALKLRENDVESIRLCEILNAVARGRCGDKLGGGGGYLGGESGRDDNDIAVLIFQKNDPDSGDLRNCDEADREHARIVLAAHPNVVSFLIGPLEGDEALPGPEAEAAEMKLVAELRAQLDAAI